ncbi:hypothetical protein CL689_03785 [Candidatus Saccharibacteria bacterium]|mgnify:FL=1|nr:hypothetical protein [Candidatus Saccharibacteria bacterium]
MSEVSNHQELGTIAEGYQTKHYTGQVAKMLKTSESTIKKSIDELGLDIEYSQCGSVSRRVLYTKDVFELAVKRREKTLKGQKTPLKIFMIWNEKGGVGKSTFAREFTTLLQLQGLRVLVVDADPQNSLTTMFGYNAEIDQEIAAEYGYPEKDVIRFHMGHLLDLPPLYKKAEAPDFADVIKKPFGEYGPHLIPSNESLSEVAFAIEKKSTGIHQLRRLIEEGIRNPSSKLDLTGYDAIIFDCNPSRTRLIDALYVASDYLICPIKLDALSIKGVGQALDVRAQLASELGPESVPTPLILGNLYKSSVSRCTTNYGKLAQLYPNNFIKGTIREGEGMNRALEDSMRVPVCLAEPSNSITSDLVAVVAEICDKADIR